MDHRQEMEMFAIASPGLEAVCAGELVRLGVAGVRTEPGGVSFRGRLADLYRANLWLRSASRILVRFATFRCRDFPRLYQKALQLPWGRFIHPQTPVELRVTCRNSRLLHTGRVRQTLLPGIDRVLGRAAAEMEQAAQLIVVRIVDDLVEISIDSSGELLHRRGYRQHVTAAPLRETLAAGILLQLGWDGSIPLYDPMCGSGTFLIEGALIATNRAPGLQRQFAFMTWPGWRSGLWRHLAEEARCGEARCSVSITGTDLDPVAVKAALSNVYQAGVAEDVKIFCTPLEDLDPQPGSGMVVCNPPYGVRLGSKELFGFYGRLGAELKRAFPLWSKALVCPNAGLAQMTKLDVRQKAELDNGGLSVGLFLSPVQ